MAVATKAGLVLPLLLKPRALHSKALGPAGVIGWLRLPPPPRKMIKKRKQDNLINVTQATSLVPPPPLPVRDFQVEAAFPRETRNRKGKGKVVVEEKVHGGGDHEHNNDQVVDDPSFKDNYDFKLSAQCIVQQAWAQATRVDGSIIVLQSGNHEFIGIRNRSTQTLYISDLIKPHACKEPSYGKLHVGIYIAAVRDAMDRAQVRDARPPGGGNGPSGSCGDEGGGPSNGGPDSGHRAGRGGGRKGGHKNEGKSSKKPKGPEGGSMKPKGGGGSMKPEERGAVRSIPQGMAIAVHEMTAKESTLEPASSRDVILLYLQYGVYDSPVPSTFVRCGPIGQAIPLPSYETVKNYQLEECLTIVLTSEIGKGATGDVLRGTLEVEASTCVSLDVAVKLALARRQRDALRNEYKIYHRLRSSGVTAGIITPLGLFDEVEDGACALVMPYVGIPLAEMPELVLPISHQEAVLATLVEIHHADILHGDLRLDNILVTDSGLTIIDFDQSRVCNDQEAKNREYSRLRSLLHRRAK